MKHEKVILISRWFQIFLFSPLPGEMIPVDYYFSNGLKPPGSNCISEDVMSFPETELTICQCLRVRQRRSTCQRSVVSHGIKEVRLIGRAGLSKFHANS